MVIDFERTETPSDYTAEVAIIGSGAAGITLALELAAKGNDVLLVESGAHRFRDEIQQLYESEVEGHPHVGIHTGRYRTYGGTTTRWGGQALEFREIDLEARSWVNLSGWPLRYEELRGYYPRAYGMLKLGAAKTDEQIWRKYGWTPPAFEDGCINSFLTRWSPRPNFAVTYRSELEHNPRIRVLHHANVVELVPVESGALLDHITISSLGGRRGAVRAKAYALCCGAIENARILLVSRSVQQAGVGNGRDWVGRCFQDHLTGPVAELVTTRRRFFGDWAGLYYHRRLKYYPKIEPSSGVQRAKAMLNIAGNFFFEDERFSDPAAAAKQILREARFGRLGKLRLRDFLAAIRQSFSARHAIYDYLWRGREFVPTTGRVLLEVHCEQPPNPENRIRLAGTTDQLGVLRSRLIWHASDQERTTIGEFCAIVDQQLAKQNLGRLRPLFDLGGPGDGWSRLLGDNNHHIGTTRMATDASLGVVDSDCRVFGVSNLYIGGSSVFPTSGHSNPTLTLIALAIRLAEPIGQSVRNR